MDTYFTPLGGYSFNFFTPIGTEGGDLQGMFALISFPPPKLVDLAEPPSPNRPKYARGNSPCHGSNKPSGSPMAVFEQAIWARPTSQKGGGNHTLFEFGHLSVSLPLVPGAEGLCTR